MQTCGLMRFNANHAKEILLKLQKPSYLNTLTHIRHEIVVKIKVVQDRETHTKHFVYFKQVSDVSA